MVEIRLLGGIEAATDGGDPIDVGPAKCQAVLAALALSPGVPVPVSRLVELVWQQDPPRTAEKTLQSYVTRLRKGLGGETIERVGDAYRLAIDPGAVDVSRFEQLAGSGDVEAALDVWTGTPLAGLQAPGLTGVVDGLVEQWLGLTEVALERQVQRDPAAAIPVLTELTSQHPFREGLWASLMTALYRTGRQADALAAYGRAREHLVEELGVEPAPRLRELEASILRHDDRLGAGPETPMAHPTGTVTFGFSDIEGSSRLWAEHRADMAVAVSRHDQLVRSIASQHSGSVFATGGDGFGVAFSRAGDAVAWAGELQAALGVEQWPPGIDLRIRIGLHTGEAEERDGDYFGPAVNIAARIAAAGHGGQTVMSEVTASLAGRPELTELGRFHLDGVGVEVAIFQLGEGEHPALRTEEHRPGNLPRRTGRLIGRVENLDVIAAALDERPVVTLVGPGGIGKTRLALAAARVAELGESDGAWLVELADLASSDEVARAVADVLGVTQGPGQTLTEAIIARLGARRSLLVLDNCEHVVEGAAALVEVLVPHCPDLSVLATSREGLGVREEQLVAIGPLDGDAAIELFAERARSADPAFDLEATRSHVADICDRLDGVPLAIELAAARVRSLDPADLVDRLDDRLRLLTGGRRRSVERHRTLRATIQWSYDLLTNGEQTVFRRLSVFAGSFDLAAAERVTADDRLPAVDVDGLIGDLVERSMLTAESGAFGRRFRMLETIRQFGAEHLTEAGESDATAARHAAYVLDEVHRIEGLLSSNDEVEGAAQLSELWPNVRAAVDWAFAQQAHAMAADLIAPIALQSFVRRGLVEVVDWAERLVRTSPDEDTVALAVLWAAMHYSMTQRREQFRELIESSGAVDHVLVRYAFLLAVEDNEFAALTFGPLAAAEMRERGLDSYARMFDLFTAASTMNAGDYEAADREFARLIGIFRAEGPPSFLNWALYLLGASAAIRGDHALADRHWDEAAAIELPPRSNSPNETLEARAAFRRGQPMRAFGLLRDNIDELVTEDNMSGVGVVAIEFINMMVPYGRPTDAGVLLGHLDATGLMAVEGPGFKLLVADAAEVVDADPAASAARRSAAERGLAEPEALSHMRGVLSAILADQLNGD